MYNTPTIIFEPLYPDVLPPTRATMWAAGYDLKAYLKDRDVTVYTHINTKVTVRPNGDGELLLAGGERAMIPLGFKAKLPMNYEAQIRPRSGLAIKQGLSIVNAPGTIDADFPHEWMVLLENRSNAVLTITHGDAIAQMVLAQYEVIPFTQGEVVVSTNRVGGFGSTDGTMRTGV